MTDQETQIQFAERQGWKWCKDIKYPSDQNYWWWNPSGQAVCGDIEDKKENFCHLLPNPTDHNHVHEAMMGMSDVEWENFQKLVWEVTDFPGEDTVICTLKLSASTLVTCFLEATKGRVK